MNDGDWLSGQDRTMNWPGVWRRKKGRVEGEGGGGTTVGRGE